MADGHLVEDSARSIHSQGSNSKNSLPRAGSCDNLDNADLVPHMDLVRTDALYFLVSGDNTLMGSVVDDVDPLDSS